MEKISRTEIKKLKTRDHILETATSLLAKSGDFKMEDVALIADVTRKTVYNHFSTKETLISEVIDPILSFCIEEANKALDNEHVELETLANLCLAIYKEFGSDLNLMYNIEFDQLGSSKLLHRQYTKLFMDIFSRIENIDNTKVNTRDSAFLVFKIFVPILDTLYKYDGYEQIFTSSLVSFVKGLKGSTTR